ncbi:hypothetical protein [Corallococcus macrosporus]|nr:hypothetical protein [Corallococcus macrosporus]
MASVTSRQGTSWKVGLRFIEPMLALSGPTTPEFAAAPTPK